MQPHATDLAGSSSTAAFFLCHCQGLDQCNIGQTSGKHRGNRAERFSQTKLLESAAREDDQACRSFTGFETLSKRELSTAMPLSDLRVILRHLGRWPTASPQNSAYKAHVMGEYRRHRCETDPAQLVILKRRASDYANLLLGVEEQKRLRALDTGAEMATGIAEAARRSAARSGLIAPEESQAPFRDLNQ